MRIVFLSNFINHHQIGVGEELFSLTDGSYRFIETEPMPESFKKRGYPDYSSRDYVVQAWNGEENERYAKSLLMEAEVVVFGGVGKVFELVKNRIDAGLLTFEMGERWLKRGWINTLSPRLQKAFWTYHLHRWSRKPFYYLCASAYAPNDLYLLHEFKDKCYKWGYFTSVKRCDDLVIKEQKSENHISFMWCARFLNWKHPEMPVLLAERLKRNGCRFVIDLFGDGEEFENTKLLIQQKNLEECVLLRGNLPNNEILGEMRRHDIYLFTSDQNEGWGAVLNEAMANGCVPVAADAIGSVPFLVRDGENGMIFKSKDIDSLEEKVNVILNNKKYIMEMSAKAKETMQLWSPKVAAFRLLKLIESLKNGRGTPFTDGPCSKAYPI